MTQRADLVRAMLPLRRDDDVIIDALGVSHDDVGSALSRVLGLCGCGTIEAIQSDALELLKWADKPIDMRAEHNEIFSEPRDPMYVELLLHLLDDARLIDHGGSVRYPWTTDLGKQWLASIDI